MLKTESVMVRCNYNNVEYYMSKGYKFNQFGDLIQVSVDDILPTSKVLVESVCDNCGAEFSQTFVRHIDTLKQYQKDLCSKCRRSLSHYSPMLEISPDQIQKEIMDACAKKEYRLLSHPKDIESIYEKIKYICPEHGETESPVRVLLNGGGCNKCARSSGAKSAASSTLHLRRDILYQNVLKEAHKKGYAIITPKDQIINNHSYIEYLCPIHGKQKMRVYNLSNGKGCPECGLIKLRDCFQLNPEEVESRINELGSKLLNKYDYINQDTKNLQVTCLLCDSVFVTSLSHFVQHGGQVCPDCSYKRSLGERRIFKYLKDKNINFEQEKRFDDCKDQRCLPFDFYLQDYNLCIEFDGQQHYVDGYFPTSIEYTQKHDSIKTKYCADNHIDLLRIPYWEIDNIGQILEMKLHEDMVSSHAKV